MAGGFRKRDSSQGTYARPSWARTTSDEQREHTEHQTGNDGDYPGLPLQRLTPPDVKHCWYDGPNGRQAALLLKWSRGSDQSRWRGYVAVARPSEDGSGEWDLVTMWVSAGLLAPAEST